MRSRHPILVIAAVVLCALVAVGIIILALQHTAPASACTKLGATHRIVIQNNTASTTVTHARLCDTLTFVNRDRVTREIAFGPHEHHVPYDGIAERFLNQNESFTITLNAAGLYHWHDHLHDAIKGTFTVAK